MCVIIRKPKGTDISLENLKRCWTANPHGAGLMFATNGFVKVIKGLMTLDSFLQAYQQNYLVEKEAIIHFRLASAGEISPDLTHPFWVFKDGETEGDIAFVHNGHLSDYDTGGISQSDTTVFRDEILSKLPHNFLHNEAIMELLRNYIYGSVLVFMDNLGMINTVGNFGDAGCGFSMNGIWYSNDYWLREDSCNNEEDQSESTLDEEEKVELYTMELRDVRDRLEAEEYMQEYIQPDMFPEV